MREFHAGAQRYLHEVQHLRLDERLQLKGRLAMGEGGGSVRTRPLFFWEVGSCTKTERDSGNHVDGMHYHSEDSVPKPSKKSLANLIPAKKKANPKYTRHTGEPWTGAELQ